MVVNDGLKEIDDYATKIGASVKYVDGSKSQKLLFHHLVKYVVHVIKETKALWLHVPIRWSSTYQMLDRELMYHCAFKVLYLADSSYKIFPTDEESEGVEGSS